MSIEEKNYLHPFVNYLKSRLESLLSLVQLEEGGQVIEPDSFKLKNLSAWSFEKYNTIFDSLGSPSGYCNLRCKFCYEGGNPLPFEKTRLSVQEAATRIRYYHHDAQKGLPLFKTRLYKEPFTNKDLIPILKMVRAADPEVEIQLTTNGSFFTVEVLEQLSRLVPVNLCVSLNSSHPEGRRRIMGDQNSEESINMIEKFKSYDLPFVGTIVAWPEIGSDELIDTIHYLDQNLARAIRITLPGFSRFFDTTPTFNTKEVWDKVLADVLPLRNEIRTPLLVLPSLYHSRALLPEVAGVIRESPAELAGIRFGDLVKSINGENVYNRAAAKKLLAWNYSNPVIHITLERKGEIFEVELREKGAAESCYPYRPAGYPVSTANPFGIILIDDFDPVWLWEILKRIVAVKAKHVLLMTSAIMEPVVAALLESVPELDNLLGETNLYLWVPKHRFWGGNIILGDLYTCSDYLQAVYDFQEKQGVEPDLIILPNSFSPNNNNDLLGVSYSSIEHVTGIPVELAGCTHITV